MLTCLMSVSLGFLAPSAAAEGKRSRQWYLDAMQAERMWQTSTGEGITVAVIDSGVDDSVPELRGQLLPGRDLSGEGRGANFDSEGHGTSMAMIIAGKRSGEGTWGLAPGSKVLPIRSVGGNWTVNMAKSIRFAADQGAKVINISRGGPASDLAKQVLQPAIDYANQKGSLIFVATGNDGAKGNAPDYPSRLPGVVGVGAVDKTLKVTKFSVHGPQVALAAPGVEVPTRCTKALLDCETWGTSDATAIASASAALVWSAHPDWTNNQVLRVMLETAGKPEDGKVPSEYLGYGIVRPRKVLLDKEGDPGPPDVNPLVAPPNTAAPSEAPRPGTTKGTNKAAQKTASRVKDDDSTTRLVMAGIVAAVGVAAIAGLVLVRRRRA
ncbi:type VII secretion-associated serine protease mycosin [Streptomyces sp. SID8354]|nr:type VII secretion-associated serine protease mycosin [Streptomyces sp. SID8354]